MFFISNYIHEKNLSGEKILSVFLTSGFPNPENFTELALSVLNAGADMIEIGFPFSDPLADGPVIQRSSDAAIKNGINLEKTFRYVKQIREKTQKPIMLMGYANPVLSYGLNNFAVNCRTSGVDGIIIPDVPLDEYENFFTSDFDALEKILLISPTTTEERIRQTDDRSSGFVYCVSVSGTTGNEKAEKDIEFIKRSRSLLKKNKMLVGFGISSEDDVKKYSPFCDGVIVGSAVIKSLSDDNSSAGKTLKLVSELKNALSG